MKYPRVTEILRPFTKYENVPPDRLAAAAARGSTVHAICAGIAKGAWIPDGMIAENLLGYVNSFKKWSQAQAIEFIEVEKRYFDEVYEFSGQIDYLILGSDQKRYLVDLKTSARAQKTYPVQMGAYWHLLTTNGMRVEGAMLVYLDKDGEFPEIDLIEDISEHQRIFWSAYECYKYFHKAKVKSKGKQNGHANSTDDTD